MNMLKEALNGFNFLERRVSALEAANEAKENKKAPTPKKETPPDNKVVEGAQVKAPPVVKPSADKSHSPVTKSSGATKKKGTKKK